MNPEELIGERIVLTEHARSAADPAVIEIPAETPGTVVAWDGEYLELAFELGMLVVPLRLNPIQFAFTTRPVSMERRLT